MERDNLAVGLLIGATVPILGFVVVEFLFNLLTEAGLMEEISISAVPRRERTILLLAICTNLIPFQLCRKNKWDHTMRGIVFPTIIYVAFWIYRYKDILF